MTKVDPLAALRLRFAERARADADALEEALLSPPGGAVEPLVHGLAGAAGIFGYAEISEAARAIDSAFGRGDAPSEASVRALIALIRRTYS